MELETLDKKSRHLSYRVSDLKNCAEEPIAFCGAIQPSGLLIVVNLKTLEIEGASANWDKAFHSWSAPELLGQKIETVVKINGDDVPPEARFSEMMENQPVMVSLRGSNAPGLQNGCCNLLGEYLTIEFDLLHEWEVPYSII